MTDKDPVCHNKKISHSTASHVNNRRIGIEFEAYSGLSVVNDINHRLQRHDVLAFDPITKTRIEIAADREDGINKHIEFVSEPLKNITQLNYAIYYIFKTTNKIIKDIEQQGFSNIGDYQLELKDKDISKNLDLLNFFVPQATTSIALEDFEQVLNNIIHTGHGVWSTMLDRLEALKLSTVIFEQLSPRVRGLSVIILYVLACLQTSGSKFIEGPKEALTIMPRSDFKSMLNSLTITEQDEFILFAKTLKEQLQGEYVFTKNKYNNVYIFLQDHKHRMILLLENNPKFLRFKNILIGDWIDSIIDDLKKKDLLSPPPFYTQNSEENNGRPEYSMGAMGLDSENNLPLFELRGIGFLLGEGCSRIQAKNCCRIRSNIFLNFKNVIQFILKNTKNNDVFDYEQNGVLQESLFISLSNSIEALEDITSKLPSLNSIDNIKKAYEINITLLKKIDESFPEDHSINQSRETIEKFLHLIKTSLNSSPNTNFIDQTTDQITDKKNNSYTEKTLDDFYYNEILNTIPELKKAINEIDYLLVKKHFSEKNIKIS